MLCALYPAQGTLFPLPHVWLDFFVYTYKFTFDYCIIKTQMSFLYAPTTSDCRPLPMMSSLSDPFRLHPSLVLRYFRFPFDYPSPPIRRLLEQWGPNRLPMLLWSISPGRIITTPHADFGLLHLYMTMYIAKMTYCLYFQCFVADSLFLQ